MNINRFAGTSGRRFLAIFLSLCLLMPGAALADGKNGKKNFREGLKYEQQQQWDMAAQHFALALSAEPNNPEYKVHYLQALQRASLMYVSRGDALAEQSDYSSAYTAYRQGYQLDPGNEIARFKMERMLELQKAQASGTVDQVNYNISTGMVRNASNEIQVNTKSRSRGEAGTDIKFKDTPFKTAVTSLSRQLNLNVVFDDTVKDTDKVSVEMGDVSLAKALDVVLLQKKHAFEQVDRRTIFVYPDNGTNRPRFEKLLIKTFYLGNISAQTAKALLAQMLPPGRQVASVDSAGGAGGAATSNILVVKATPAELQLVQDLLGNIDKNKNEVVLDIEIYEVSNDSLLQIGNQIATSSGQLPAQQIGTRTDTGEPIYGQPGITTSLTNLGGFGNRSILPSSIGSIGALVAGGIGTGGAGFLLGLPPTSLSLLQSQGKSKLLNKTQIHVLDGGQNKTKVGRSVPVRLGTQNFGNGGLNVNLGNTGTGTGTGNNIGQNLQNLLGGFGNGFNSGFDSIQYRDVGLVIDAQPTITNEGYVEIKMNFETSDVVASGSDAQNLTPVFTQRSLNTVARIRDGVTAVVAGVNQDNKGDSRAGIPVLGMLPFVGRLFTTPRQESRQTDVIITVTPHIVRSAGITEKDNYALIGPPQQGSLNQSIEEVVNRAQVEEEEERREIAKRQSPGTPLDAAASLGAQPAKFNNTQQRPGASTQPVSNTQRPGANSPLIQPVGNSNRKVISNQGPSSPQNPAVTVPPEAPETQQQDIQIQVNQNDSGSGNPQPEKEKSEQNNETPDLSSLVNQPAEPVAQAQVMSSRRPENVERAIARMMLEERSKRAAEASKPMTQEAPPEIPNELLVSTPKQKVAPATLKAVNNSRANSGVNFSISPKPIKQQVGKTFTVTVEVNGQERMSGADIALKYDASKLQVKSVRDDGLFGEQADFSYDKKQSGTLIVNVKQPQGTLILASGRLVTVEFSAIGEGQSEIAFNSDQTRARVGGAQVPAGGGATQVIIGRDSVTTSTDK